MVYPRCSPIWLRVLCLYILSVGSTIPHSLVPGYDGWVRGYIPHSNSKLKLSFGVCITPMQRRALYSSAILLVRNPLDALVSEWNRKKVLEMKAGQNGSSHTTSTGPEFFDGCSLL